MTDTCTLRMQRKDFLANALPSIEIIFTIFHAVHENVRYIITGVLPALIPFYINGYD